DAVLKRVAAGASFPFGSFRTGRFLCIRAIDFGSRTSRRRRGCFMLRVGLAGGGFTGQIILFALGGATLGAGFTGGHG
ncbi:MAG: hypothetical protein M3Y57_12660, partial [Acidobacteriota bacterium]|nr:hypothetical protein [Acidobacteriota bacterium]